MLIPLSLLITTSAVLHLRADHLKNRTQIYLFKPLTTSLILLLALLSQNPPTEFYKWAVVAGLIFSLAGDVFLMLPGNRFLMGLVSFLIAHLWYIAAFANPAGFYMSLLGLLPFLVYGAAVYTYLWPGLRKMKIPAFLYMLAIVVMAWQALGLWQQTAETPALLAFTGALLFVASDSILALNRFRRPFSAAQPLIMSTYFTAQYLIALSI
jgi:uncharacterized membrane protein YhhN